MGGWVMISLFRDREHVQFYESGAMLWTLRNGINGGKTLLPGNALTNGLCRETNRVSEEDEAMYVDGTSVSLMPAFGFASSIARACGTEETREQSFCSLNCA